MAKDYSCLIRDVFRMVKKFLTHSNRESTLIRSYVISAQRKRIKHLVDELRY